MSILHFACRDDEGTDFVKQLATELPYFSKVVDDQSNEDGWTPLMWAAQKGNIETIQELVANGANVMKTKTDGISLYHMAASNNDVHLLDYAISLKAHTSLNLKNDDGWTPAHMAGFLNNFDSLNLLLENGASLDEKNNNALSCYEEIVRADNADLLECIYPLVQDILRQRNLSKKATYSLLHLASGSEGPKSLKFLLEKAGESPNQICNADDRATALHFAVLSDKIDNARILLRYGANPNAKDSMGNSALHYSVANRQLRLVKLLEDYNADGTLPNEDDICPIDISITEDIKDIRMYFMSLNKYRNFDFSGLGRQHQEQQTSHSHSAFTTENTKAFQDYTKQ